MEAFSLLKYWKSTAGAGGGGTGGAGGGAFPLPGGAATGTTTTIVTAVGDHAEDSDSDAGAGDDDGPFFDLEFAVPADEEEEDGEEKREKLERVNGIIDEGEEEEENDDVGEIGGEREVKFRLSSSTSSCDRSLDPNMSLSPSDDLFYNGRIVRIDGSEEEIGSKSGQFPVPVSLLRSATKFRVFMLGLKRSKSESTTTTTTKSQPQKENQNQNQNQPQNQQQSNKNNKFFTVKFKVEEVPIISLLTRASSNSKPNNTTATIAEEQQALSTSDSCDEKRNKMETMQKYLKLVKPLYVRVSKRHQATPADTAAEPMDAPPAVVEVAAEGRRETKGMKLKGIIAKKHLGKSKSAVVHSMPPNVASNRRDDSLLQQQDGIQSAILHCKRSFNASREMEEASSVLSRSASDPSHEKKTTVTTMASELRREQERNDVVWKEG